VKPVHREMMISATTPGGEDLLEYNLLFVNK
jgi:hypothetical protein